MPLADAPTRPPEAASSPAEHAAISTGHAELSAASAEAMQTQFASREELLAYVTEFSFAQGYAVVIHKSNLPRGQLWLRCDLGGSAREGPQQQLQPASPPKPSTPPPPSSPETGASEPVVPPKRKRKRKSTQRFQNCPFQLYGRRVADGTWVVKVQNDLHTHPLASRKQDLVMHPKARRLSNGQKRLVMGMTDLGIRPAVIVERLKARFPDEPIKVQDVYNARNHIRMERLAGREPFPEARESDEGSATDGPEGSARHGHRRGRRLRPHPGSGELQRLWTSVLNVVPRWPEQRQSNFVQNVHALLAPANGENTTFRSQPQERNPAPVDGEPTQPTTMTDADVVTSSVAQQAPATEVSASTENDEDAV